MFLALPKITTSCDTTTVQKDISKLSVQFEELNAQYFIMSGSEPPAETTALFTEHQIERLALLMLLSCSLGGLRKNMGTNTEHIDKPARPTKKRKSRFGLTTTSYAQSAVKAAQKILHIFADVEEPKNGWTWTCVYACFCATAIISIAIVNGHTNLNHVIHVKRVVEYFRKAARQQSHEFYSLTCAQLDKLWAEVKVVADRKAPSTKRQTTIKGFSSLT